MCASPLIKAGSPAFSHVLVQRVMTMFTVLGLAAILTACGDNPQSVVNPDANGGSAGDEYKGPDPATDDVQSFKIEFWENLRGANRCGNCHGTGGQSPNFVHGDDINIAYDFAKSVVDVTNPSESAIVAKVGQGHNCWIENDNRSCAEIIERYITRWLGSSDSSGRSIQITAPANIYDPGDSRSFPLTAQDNGANSFASTVYPLLRSNCQACHAEDASSPQAPFFAGSDVNTAYLAAQAKMDLDTPANSRFVLRLGEEFHNCWSSVCADDAADMQAAISAFAGAIPLTQVDPALVTSKAMKLTEAIVASGGRRFEDNLIALWEFKTGTGITAYDTSGVDPALNLDFVNGSDIGWVMGYGIDINSGYAQGSSALATRKLRDHILQTGEYSIEAWVVPANVTQEDSSIISYSGGNVERNFTLGQTLYNYDFVNHSTRSPGTIASKLMTNDDDRDLQASLQHVVMNFDPVNGRQIYVNGVATGDSDIDALKGGSIVTWDETYAFTLGNETGGAVANQWKGKVRLAAIHKRVLTPEQIRQNFAVGVGQKYLMLFSVEHLIDDDSPETDPGSYIMFEVEQYDNNSYLFNAPKFINLDPNWTPSSAIPIKGMRLGINGKEAVVGQAFANLDTQITSAQYSANGQVLSSLGTIIALEQGPDQDEFFLTFEQLGANTNSYTEAAPATPTAPADAEMVSDIGVRTFDEINASMSAMTGIPVTNTAVSATFNQYRRQLPAIEDIQAYLSSHQMAVAQLAMKYCDELVDTNPAYFSPFNMGNAAGVAFDTQAERDQILSPLLRAVMNVDTSNSANNLLTQPDETDIRNSLSSFSAQSLDSYGSYNSLMDCMTRCARGGTSAMKCAIADIPAAQCTAGDVTAQNTTARTREVVKATCAAMLGSAVMLIQ